MKPGHEVSIEARDKIDKLWNDASILEFVECHELIARRASELMRFGRTNHWKVDPGDAVQLASAQWVGVIEVHTYEPSWQRYEVIINTRITEPHADQPLLLNAPGT